MTSSEMPELGSKISLISKADIRYEGKLFTVNPQDCTIALANVRSFGTEDRETENPVAPQSKIYDYILFRATDIKDISVVPTTQLLYDPAIIQLSASQGIGSAPGRFGSTPPGSSSFSHPSVLGNLAGSVGQYQGFNPMQSGLQGISRPSPKLVLDLLSGSRSSSPGLRKGSPTMDQGTQASFRKAPSPQKDDKHRNQQGIMRNQVQDHRNDRQQNMRNNRPDQPQLMQRPRNNYQQQQQQHQQPQQQNHNQGHQNNMRGGNMWGNNRNPQGGNRNRGNSGGSGAAGGNPNAFGGQQLNMGGGANNRGGQRNFSRAPGTSAHKKLPLKFDADYDFDKANTEFEELRTQLAKVKIDAAENAAAAINPVGAPPVGGVVNGDEKKDDSGNETGIVEIENEEPYFYNKTKSFFDNISCEAIERSKGRSQRTDWRKERKLNTETFGVSMARRGMYRGGGGRGGYYYQRGGGYFQQGRGMYRQPFRQNNKQNHRLQQPQQQQPQITANA